ncbi:MAG TPA: signal peptidase I [Lachnospiraceae bacterium]|nr:signal peptidase I [Lachnospiraceae bacterium]
MSRKQQNEKAKNQNETLEEDKTVEKKSMKREIIDTVLYFIFLLVAVWAIVTFVGQRTVVNGVSMYDTLNDGDNLWVDKFSYHFKDPQRFDIVVFPMYDGEEYFIKRIIGLPGETVRIDHQGNIYINGEKLEESYGYETIEPGMIGRAFDGVTLGDDEYFVMGDNRNESEDSRFDIVGNVKREDLMGKAVFRLWPIATFGTID